MVAYNYSNTSVATTLSAPIGTTDTSITIGDTSGLPPSFPYTLIIDYEGPGIEVVSVTNLVGTTLTVSRGEDGTAAQSHPAGVKVVHGAVRRDFVNMATHIEASSNVHGIGSTSTVVGTATAQTLTNKTISGANNTITNIPDSAITQPFKRVTGVGADGTKTVLDILGDEGGRTADIARIGKTTGEGLNVSVAGLVTASKGGVLVADGDLTMKKVAATQFSVANATGNVTAAGSITATTGPITTPGTVIGADFIVPGSPNRSLRDDLQKTPNVRHQRIGSGSFTISSASFVDVLAPATINKMYAATKLLITFTCSGVGAVQNGASVQFAFHDDIYGDREIAFFFFNQTGVHHTIAGQTILLDSYPIGPLSFKLTARMTSGSGQQFVFDSNDRLSFSVMEIPG